MLKFGSTGFDPDFLSNPDNLIKIDIKFFLK